LLLTKIIKSIEVLRLLFLTSQFYFVLNLAVGGVNNFFPDDAENPGGKPWLNTSPQVQVHPEI
jgi:hypothetical protein